MPKLMMSAIVIHTFMKLTVKNRGLKYLRKEILNYNECINNLVK